MLKLLPLDSRANSKKGHSLSTIVKLQLVSARGEKVSDLTSFTECKPTGEGFWLQHEPNTAAGCWKMVHVSGKCKQESLLFCQWRWRNHSERDSCQFLSEVAQIHRKDFLLLRNSLFLNDKNIYMWVMERLNQLNRNPENTQRTWKRKLTLLAHCVSSTHVSIKPSSLPRHFSDM